MKTHDPILYCHIKIAEHPLKMMSNLPLVLDPETRHFTHKHYGYFCVNFLIKEYLNAYAS